MQPGEVPPPVDNDTTDDTTEDIIIDPFAKPVVIAPEEDDGIRSDQIALAVFILIALIVLAIGTFVVVKHFRDKRKKEETGGAEPKDSETESETERQFNNLPTHGSATPGSPRKDNLNNWPTDENQKDSIVPYGKNEDPPAGQYG